MSAKVVSQPGASPNGMKTSETNNSGSIEALTMAGDASRIGYDRDDGQAKGTEGGCPDYKSHDEGRHGIGRHVYAIEQCSRRRDDDHQQYSNNNGVPDPSQHQRPAGERRAPDAARANPASLNEDVEIPTKCPLELTSAPPL